MKQEESDIRRRLASLERRHRSLRRWVALGLVTAGAGALVAASGSTIGERVLRVEEVVIEDANGVVRARLGGDLPDAVFDGRRVDRGTKAAGLLLYDRRGHERGGYVTFDGNDHVLLTLDAGAEGQHRQTAFFVAESGGATTLRIWSGDDHVELRSGVEGARFNAVEDGEVVFQMPRLPEAAVDAMCTELRALRDRAELGELLDACRQRMPAEACRLCLGEPEGAGQAGG